MPFGIGIATLETVRLRFVVFVFLTTLQHQFQLQLPRQCVRANGFTFARFDSDVTA